MSCWDNCGYVWRAVGESTSCTRNINDGTVVTARLTIEVTDIRYDSGCIEPCYHQFDAIVKIYQLYDGDVFETLVYESVDTFDYNLCGVYYKYNEWEVCFHDIIESPAEVNIKISNKELCPGCTHPYICDCEDTIGWEDWSITYAPAATNNPDPETIHVKLLDIEAGRTSIRVEIKIYRDGIVVYTDASAIINDGSYIDISDSSTEHDWRVACNGILLGYQVTVQLCFNFNDSGSGSGTTGSGMIAAQYFDTTSFGWTGGCIIRSWIDNPKSDGGNNTAPTEIELSLYSWQTDYTTTINSTPIVTETMITPSELLQDRYWIPFIWNTDIEPGEYMWSLTCLRGPHDGSFALVFIDYGPAQLWDAWVNGYSHRNFYSRIMGIETVETWEKSINVDDSFNSGYFGCIDGYNKIKINGSTGYENAMTTKKDSNTVGVGVSTTPTGRITDGSNILIV